jgi:hypothetical protein
MAADPIRTPASRTTLGMERLEDRVNPTPTSDIFTDRVLIGLTPGQEAISLTQIAATGVTDGARHLGFNVYKVTLKPGVSVAQGLAAVTGKLGVRYAHPDFKLALDAMPNDPEFANGNLWGQHNTGQNGGTPNADFDAPEAWERGTGTRGTIVAVVDDGIDSTHPDLAANMWTNPGEVPGNGVDDDANGYVDDIHGWDFSDNDANANPDAGGGHGTHVAGTIGAVGNNGIGVAGANWATRLMAIKIFGSGGGVSAAIEGFNYATMMGAKILNNSWRYYGDIIPAFADAMTGVQRKGGIMVASAGNDALNNDTVERYPSNFTRLFDNAVAVAALDRNDNLASFSNTGPTLVTLGAPGVEIMSTYPGGYRFLDGTSMSTPQVSGALALAWDLFPSATYQELIQALKASTVPIPALAGRTVTGGRLNMNELLNQLNTSVYATGAGAGGGPVVHVFRGSSGRPFASLLAYQAGFTGGVRVATGDFNGDGVTDVVTVPGKGGAPHVKIFDGKTFQEIASFFAFESEFTGGLQVAAGDVDGDGLADVVVGADTSGAPRVSIFQMDPTTGGVGMIGNFFAYDTAFTGGVRLALGDFDGDGKNEVVTAAGHGGGPHVRVFSAASALTASPTPVRDFFAGNLADRNGLFVAAGDFSGDKLADIVVSTGAGNSPTVRVYNGATLAPLAALSARFGALPGLVIDDDLNITAAPIQRAFPENLLPPSEVPSQLPSVGGQSPRSLNGYIYGVRVATHDVNNDGQMDMILAGGPGDAPEVTLINGKTFGQMRNFSAYENFFYGGVFVGTTGDNLLPDDSGS